MGRHSKRVIRRSSVPRFVVGATALAAAATIAEPFIARADDTGNVDWAAIAQCESGGNPRTNTGNGFYGMYQFTLSTWRASGGRGMPQDASPTEQTRVAENVQRTQGLGAWPVCGRHAYREGTRQVHFPVVKSQRTSRHAAPEPLKPVIRPDVLMGPQLYPGGTVYTATAGDSLASIANRYQIPGGWQHLTELNHIDDPNFIYPGQVLALD